MVMTHEQLEPFAHLRASPPGGPGLTQLGIALVRLAIDDLMSSTDHLREQAKYWFESSDLDFWLEVAGIDADPEQVREAVLSRAERIGRRNRPMRKKPVPKAEQLELELDGVA
jgi:hypothetical protein